MVLTSKHGDLPGFFVDPGKKRMKMMDEPLQKKAYMVPDFRGKTQNMVLNDFI